MSTNYLMGDYSFGMSSSVATLSPVEYKQNSTSKSFFDNVTHNMPDDLLLDKSNTSLTGKQTESQQPSTNGESVVNNGEANHEHFSPNKSKSNDDAELNLKNQLDSQLNGGEITSSGTSSSGLHLEFTDAMANASITTSAPSFWSGDEGFSPGVSPIKNALSFQNFPNTSSMNQVYNSSLGPQISIPQSLPPQRRAITGAHNFNQSRHQQPQSNLLKNFSNWSNPQSTSWSAPQTPNGIFPWNVNLANQKRSVPNMPATWSAQKKPPQTIGQHSMVISPSKFRRSTSLPLGKQFPHSIGVNSAFDMSTLEENRDANVIFPFQDQISGNVNSNPLENIRFPLEQQLGIFDLMRNSNTENQEQIMYKGIKEDFKRKAC